MDQPDPGGLTRDGEAPDLIDIDDQPVSAFDLLRRAADDKIQRDDIEKPVPNRPGYAVRYTLAGLDPRRMQSINRRARAGAEVDNDTVNALVLAEQCVGLVIDGQPVTDEGRPLRFGSSLVREALGVKTAADATRVWYGGPTREYGFAIMRHANELLQAAGLADESEDDLDSDDDPSTAAR